MNRDADAPTLTDGPCPRCDHYGPHHVTDNAMGQCFCCGWTWSPRLKLRDASACRIPRSVTFKIPHGSEWSSARIHYGVDGGADLPHGHPNTWDWNKTRRSLSVAIAKWLASAPERWTDQ